MINTKKIPTIYIPYGQRSRFDTWINQGRYIQVKIRNNIIFDFIPGELCDCEVINDNNGPANLDFYRTKLGYSNRHKTNFVILESIEKIDNEFILLIFKKDE